MTSDGLARGDLLKIERRYAVDGDLKSVVDEGRFQGIQRVGSAEHIVIKDVRNKEVRMFPLSAVAEITLVKPARRPREAKAPEAVAPTLPWDPSFA